VLTPADERAEGDDGDSAGGAGSGWRRVALGPASGLETSCHISLILVETVTAASSTRVGRYPQIRPPTRLAMSSLTAPVRC
jgi:hypothetical protein